MDLRNAIVYVRSEQYEGYAILRTFNDDGTVTVFSELTGAEYRVPVEVVERAPVTDQPVAWIAHQLVEAWQPAVHQVARRLAERFREYAQYGEPEETDAIFQQYVNNPGWALRTLCRGE